MPSRRENDQDKEMEKCLLNIYKKYGVVQSMIMLVVTCRSHTCMFYYVPYVYEYCYECNLCFKYLTVFCWCIFSFISYMIIWSNVRIEMSYFKKDRQRSIPNKVMSVLAKIDIQMF
jgi:hypothetical protein